MKDDLLIRFIDGKTTPEETEALKEQMKTEIYTQPTLSADLSARISGAMEVKGVEASILEVLGTIHDNWVKSNGKKLFIKLVFRGSRSNGK